MSTTTATIWVITAVGLVLRLARFTQSGPRTAVVGYDDGVYFGASVRLVHGSLPYRDFVFVHPPVITELMAPLAALSPSVSTVHLVEIARVLTALVGTATIPLLGRLLRHRGTLAVAIGCGVLALHASSIATTRAVLIEPYLTFFVVLAVVLLFDGDEPAGKRRTLIGGIVLGVAVATKIWALAPVVVLLVLFARDRSRLTRLAGGIVLGAVVPCLPFLIASPGAFFHDVVVAQVSRHTARTGELSRMSFMLGLAGFHPVPGIIVALIVVALAVLLVIGYRRLWRTRRPVRLEIAAIALLVVTIAMFYYPDVFFWHYGGYVGPFLGLAGALPATGIELSVRHRSGQAIAAVLVVAAALLGWSAVNNNDSSYWSVAPVAAVDRLVPKGRCVVTDNVSVALAVDRLSTDSSCPVVVDPFGAGIVLSKGRTGPAATKVPRVHRFWDRVVRKADVLLLRRPSLRFLPWRGDLRAYVLAHFRGTRLAHGGFLVFIRR